MPRSRRSLVLFVPAAILLGLAALLAGRFWLAPDPEVPSFSPARAVAFPSAGPSVVRAAEVPRLTGRVVDPEGAPVVDAIVYARVDGVPVWTRSVANGAYELLWPRARGVERDPAAQVDLVVVAWGFPPVSFEVASGDSPYEAILPPRQEAPPAPPAHEGSVLTGRLVRPGAEADERPFAYEVVFLPATPPEEFGAPVTRRTTCAQDGSFAFEDLAHGSYRPLVLPAWAAAGSWPDVLAPSGALFVHPSSDGAPAELELAVGALSGLARDAHGQGVEGALVLLVDAADPTHLWPPVSSDELGAFRLLDLPPGSYLVSVQAGEARLTDLPVEIAAGAESELPLPPLELRR